jgi:hypothetical protein
MNRAMSEPQRQRRRHWTATNSLSWLLLLGVTVAIVVVDARSTDYPTKSGIKLWVDPDTPEDKHNYTTSRGRRWELVMSDEFTTPNRSFKAGDDHMWTSIDKPDGVNGALQVYSHNMTSTACDKSGECYLYLEILDEETNMTVYNEFLHPPDFMDVTFYYRSAMLQTWNKFCFQGGLFEVRAQLPGATSEESGNPDMTKGKNGRVEALNYYPTWPGIWLLGNLGRAIFSASTSRMWPFSYDRCEPDVLEPHNQRISACDDNPGFGLNPNQGRGAPEIDLLEGGGVLISSSLQIGPGMPTEFRLFAPDEEYDEDPMCVYGFNCQTPGANFMDVPTSYYKKERGHRSWYKGLRYTANNFCAEDPTLVQSYDAISESVATGVVENTCALTTCPASNDVNSDMGLVDDVGPGRWGINANGTCHARINSYMGVFLCDPDSMDQRCETPRNATSPPANAMDPFTYQMDAISANWPIHMAAYTDFVTYGIEWVTGAAGYTRWMVEGHVIFEVTSDTLINVTQNADNTNPVKIMLEEPMYVIFNVALSRKWAVAPPNPGEACRGDGTDDETNRICDSFPMYMKIDYVRIYQDMGDDLPADSYMQLGCDPASHPTKGWIDGHIDEYTDYDNLHVEVAGLAYCTTDDDCTVDPETATKLLTGKCVNSRCKCLHPMSWGGPRCTTALAEMETTTSLSQRVYGPPMELSIGFASITVLATLLAVWRSVKELEKESRRAMMEKKRAMAMAASTAAARANANGPVSILMLDEAERVSKETRGPIDNYSQNFV